MADSKTTVVKAERNVKPSGIFQAKFEKKIVEKVMSKKPMEIYIGEYWFDGRCIKTYQKDPVVMDIELAVHSAIAEYDRMMEKGEWQASHRDKLMHDLAEARILLIKANDRRKKGEQSYTYVAGSKLLTELEEVARGKLVFGSVKTPIEPDDVTREECDWQQLWITNIRVLLHAGELKNDFENGEGYRLINGTVSFTDLLLENLM